MKIETVGKVLVLPAIVLVALLATAYLRSDAGRKHVTASLQEQNQTTSGQDNKVFVPVVHRVTLESGVRTIDLPINMWADGYKYSFVCGVVTTGNVVLIHYNGGDGNGGWDVKSTDQPKFYTNALVSFGFTALSPGTTDVYYIIARTTKQ